MENIRKPQLAFLRGPRKQDSHCRETALVIHPLFSSPTHQPLQRGPAGIQPVAGNLSDSAIWDNVPPSVPKRVQQGCGSQGSTAGKMFFLMILNSGTNNSSYLCLSQWISHSVPTHLRPTPLSALVLLYGTDNSVFTMEH